MPQSSQNADEGAFSAPHFAQRWDIGLPHAAQNFLLVVLSVPQLVQRIAIVRARGHSPPLYHWQQAMTTSFARRTNRSTHLAFVEHLASAHDLNEHGYSRTLRNSSA